LLYSAEYSRRRRFLNWKAIAYVTLAGMCGCGSPNPPNWKAIVVSPEAISESEPDTTDHLVVYLDVSSSMAGYVSPNGAKSFGSAPDGHTVFSHTLQELRNIITSLNKPVSVVFRQVHSSVSEPSFNDLELNEASISRRTYRGAETNLAQALSLFSTKQEEAGNQIRALPALVNSAFASFQKEVDQFFRSQKKEIDALRETLEQYKQDAHPRNENVDAPLHDHFTSTMEVPRIDTFPVAVREYLTIVARESTTARDDPLHEGILVNDPNGAFILVKDPGMRDGLIYAIPKVPYFRSQEFHTYYDKYYICNKPSSGEVTIVEPATVDKVDGGWRLRDMGILEIHRS
jgi:hypothetical protein